MWWARCVGWCDCRQRTRMRVVEWGPVWSSCGTWWTRGQLRRALTQRRPSYEFEVVAGEGRCAGGDGGSWVGSGGSCFWAVMEWGPGGDARRWRGVEVGGRSGWDVCKLLGLRGLRAGTYKRPGWLSIISPALHIALSLVCRRWLLLVSGFGCGHGKGFVASHACSSHSHVAHGA